MIGTNVEQNRRRLIKSIDALRETSEADNLAGDLAERLRQIEASQRLTEMLSTQIFTRFALATGDMSGFVNVVLDNMDADIRRAAGQADANSREAALDVVDYFENFRGRALVMISPKAAYN